MLNSLQMKYLTPACLLYVHIVKNILSSVFTIQFQVTVQIETVYWFLFSSLVMIVTFRKSNDFIFNEYDKQFPQHHSSHFSDFQLLDKGNDTVLLSIQGHPDNLDRNFKQRNSDKIIWQVGKSFKDIRMEKEAPPKNVVKDRLKNFELGSDKNHEIDASNKIHQDTITPNPAQPERLQTVSCSSLDEESEPSVGKKLEHKRSVKDLLSDFEKKSKALQQEEKEHMGGIGSFLLKDTHESGHRRACSDTETMNFATSSDEDEDDKFSGPYQLKQLNSLPHKDQNSESEIQSKTIENEVMESMPVKATDSNVDGVVVREDTYLAMTPAKSLSSLSNSGLRNPHHKTSLLSAHNSITSLTSSHGSSQSITSQNFQRFNNADKNFEGMTPSEVLTQAASGEHLRTPSQTLVMEHFHPDMSSSLYHRHHLEEETYVDMNEDGTNRHDGIKYAGNKAPILAKNYSFRDNLDSTLTFDPPESPRYHEIDEESQESGQGLISGAHYELLSNARSDGSRQPQYEALYHEISENEHQQPISVSTPMKKSHGDPPPPLRPIEGLPDILGNAPTNKGNSSSDADDESSKDFDAVETKTRQTITLDDSFRPASFYLSSYTGGGSQDDDDSSDSDLVSPPPVPSSPPPMEEVLGFTSSNNLDSINYSEGSNDVFAAARSSSVLKERTRRDSFEDHARHPSVGSFMSQHSGNQRDSPALGSNREAAKSPLRHHGSHQSISSRELPPVPIQNVQLQGSQQSLASKEIQQIGSRVGHQSNENIFRNSPYHSREGSLDNEAFLFHKFTQGTSISDFNKRHGSDSAELSSSDTNYEQEYRRYHLENIQEVSNTLERSESGAHNTSIISQELNISYNSVYDSRLQHPPKQKPDDIDRLKYFQPEPRNKEIEIEMDKRSSQVVSPRGKVPYYMSDIMADGTVVQRPIHPQDRPHQDESSSLGVVDAITKSMNALDVESKSYFEEKNAKENERIKMLRRSYTPDPFLAVSGDSRDQATSQSQVSLDGGHVPVRSKSLEGLLGDSQGGRKDNIGYAKHSQDIVAQQAPRPPSSTSKRGPPPPPPPGVPPLDITPLTSPTHMLQQSHNYPQSQDDEDDMWADSLRRASIRQRAKSIDSVEDGRVSVTHNVKSSVPPPTAPKPKTPVHMLHQSNGASAVSNSYNPDMMSHRQFASRHNMAVNHCQTNEFQFSGPVQTPVSVPVVPAPGTVPARHRDMFMQEFKPGHGYHNPSWQPSPNMNHGVIQRNSVVQRNENFLDGSLPNPSSDPAHPQMRPTSRDPAASDRMGRQSSRDSLSGKSMTLPARIKYSQDSLPRDQSFDSDNSPRTRTSKSGLQDYGEPVPASPGPSTVTHQNNNQNKYIDPSFSSHKDFSSHQNYRGIRQLDTFSSLFL